MRGAWLPWPGKTKATLICSLAPRGGYIPTRRESQRRHRRQCRPGDRGEALLGGIGDVRSRPRHAALGYRSGGLQTTTQAGGRTSPPRPVELSRPVSERELTWSSSSTAGQRPSAQVDARPGLRNSSRERANTSLTIRKVDGALTGRTWASLSAELSTFLPDHLPPRSRQAHSCVAGSR